jgi:hypothetical protein
MVSVAYPYCRTQVREQDANSIQFLKVKKVTIGTAESSQYSGRYPLAASRADSACYLLVSSFSHILIFDPQDGANKFLKNVG